MAELRGGSFPTEGDGSLNSVFSHIPLSIFEAASKSKVFVLPSNTSVAHAAQLLGERNFLCAPVVDVSLPENASWSEKYTGIVDFLSIVDWMVTKMDGKVPKTLKELCSIKDIFTSTPISVLAGTARWSAFVPLDYKADNMLDVMLLLGKYGVHRVCAVDTPGGDIHSIITQSSVVGLLNNNIDMLKSVADKTVEELGLCQGQRPIISVKSTDTYWTAFSFMSKNLVSALPVLNEKGKLVGNVSVKDLRHRLQNDGSFILLNKPLENSPDFSIAHFTCKKNTKLRDIIERISKTGIHRVYLVDDEEKPLGVVALREIICCLVKEPDSSRLSEYFAY